MRVRIAQFHQPHIRIPPGSHAGCRANKRSLSQRLLRWSRNAFLAIGVLALGYSGYVLLDTKIYQAYQTRRFQQQLSNLPPAIASANAIHGLPVAPVVDGTLGRIEIARIGLAAMILEGVDNRTLRRAVGHIPGTSLPGEPGNVAVAGHRDTFFRALRNVRHNDEITLTTLTGSYRYLVDFAEVVAPEDTQVLDDSGGNILTLVTCYPFYFVGPAPKRFIVRAHEISG
jgi:sortase A